MKKLIPFLILLFAFTGVVYAANSHSGELESGTSDFFSAPNTASLSITGDFTMEAWVNPESLSGDNRVINKNTEAGSQESYRVLRILATSVGVTMSNGGSDFTSAAVSYTVTTESWQHLAITYDASAGQIELYVDGVSQGTDTGTLPTSIFDSTAEFRLGTDGGGTDHFDGGIDDVRIWDDIRTTAEIADNNDCILLGTEANLVAYWKLDNNGTDETSNNNDLTAQNSAGFTTDTPHSGSACPETVAVEEATSIIIISWLQDLIPKLAWNN